MIEGPNEEAQRIEMEHTVHLDGEDFAVVLRRRGVVVDPDDIKDVMFQSYDIIEAPMTVYYSRFETDAEISKRVAAEKQKEIAAAKLAEEMEERAEYERLKRKYG